MIYVMQIVNTHGVRGEVKALHYTDGEAFFKKVKTVYKEDGTLVGEVTKIETYGAQELLRVKANGKSHLIPFVDRFLKEVNTKEKKIVIVEMVGLI